MIKILDCTLRDGGYVNDWCFSQDTYSAITSELQNQNIDFIEIGLIGKQQDKRFKTKFVDLKSVPFPLKIKNTSSLFTVMITYSEAKDIEIPEKKDTGIEVIRLAYFKPEIDKALKLAIKIKEKGYLVFLQAMATFLYTDDELKKMIQKVNKLQPFFFCMVDSFGVMYNDDVMHMYSLINNELSPGIGLGFHAHNNQQMALSNAITFLSECEKSNRLSCVDASIYGMGRGAGNVNLELLMHYLNKKFRTNYAPDKILFLWDKYLKKDFMISPWGYTWEYFLSSKYDVNSAYIWYLKNKNIHTLNGIQYILGKIPYSERYTLKKNIVDSLINEWLEVKSDEK